MKNKILSIDFEIIWKSIHTSLTEDEKALLDKWLAENEKHRKYYEQAVKHFSQPQRELEKPDTTSLWKEVEQAERGINTGRRRLLFSVAASAALLIAALFIFLDPPNSEPETTLIAQQNGTPGLPGKKKAILRLSNGQTIELGDKKHTGSMVDGSAIDITDASVRYNHKAQVGKAAVAMHEIIIPRGGEFTLVLADGTKIWLNSQSSLRYPAAFNGDKRIVELTGEAYFEVAHIKAQPFEVVTANQTITVLGTSFNVSHYPEDKEIVSTLVEGKVRVNTTGGSKTTLSPGEQAVYNKSDNAITRRKVNVEKCIAWKNGLFYFENEPLEKIMTTLSRWYDIEVVYANPGQKQKRFTGTLKRYDTFENVIDLIEMTQDVKFRIKENVVNIE
ncbi:DUF4974 domain-containing protein [Fulvivirga ulvae]|uniref:FecR family protein n=1 Tax=Fulvivirga ulvae TaxID=2904245 RepID=UPI001F1898C9|nr:FecR domain-containing protein [Fulvivirga ulvae]UII31827.1 DUF4974 domain-containing protein [Fulvivirga ulvae]